MYDNEELTIKDKILELAHGQFFGVLCTQNSDEPYGSIIGLAFSDDLKYAVFATPKATRKYQNLTKCQNVALVVNDREQHPSDLMKIQAFTAIGIADEIFEYNPQSSWVRMLVNKHSYLRDFLKSPTTSLFRVTIIRYFHVCSFQEVREWSPE